MALGSSSLFSLKAFPVKQLLRFRLPTTSLHGRLGRRDLRPTWDGLNAWPKPWSKAAARGACISGQWSIPRALGVGRCCLVWRAAFFFGLEGKGCVCLRVFRWEWVNCGKVTTIKIACEKDVSEEGRARPVDSLQSDEQRELRKLEVQYI